VYIKLVEGSYKSLGESISAVAYSQATMKGKRKYVGYLGRFVSLITVVLILGLISMDQDVSLLIPLWTLHSAVANTGWLNLLMLKMDISDFAKTLLDMTDQIPRSEKVKGMTNNQIKVELIFGQQLLAWHRQWCWNTLNPNERRNNVTLCIYWPPTQSLIE